ncbi:short-chain dehydrogenase/reductase SDR [Komagataeibacter xylinus E25]|nr:short-chain dehydrogenase/reductase SDR [Komagataeibacter xylinus E25]
MRLTNKVALITGGNSGIGFATAQRFIEEGAKVAITGRNQETLDAAAKALGENALSIRIDVTEDGAAEHAVSATVDRFGGLDIVFANAGIPGATPIGGTDLTLFSKIVATNLTAVFATVQAASPHLRAGASIILVGSAHQVLGFPGASAYAASKGGISSMNRVLASEFAPRGIRVNSVVPGAIRTPIWRSRAPDEAAMAKLESVLSKQIPLGHIGEPLDVANAVLFLACDESKQTTGSELVVDGGSIGAPAGAAIFRLEP